MVYFIIFYYCCHCSDFVDSGSWYYTKKKKKKKNDLLIVLFGKKFWPLKLVGRHSFMGSIWFNLIVKGTRILILFYLIYLFIEQHFEI